MPPRKRHKKAEEHRDPVVRFAEALKRDEARKQREREQRKAAKLAAELAAQRAEEIRLAKLDLDAAIAAAKLARRDRRNVAEADEAWRLAKARVVELETGEAPAWAAMGGGDHGDPDADAGDTTAETGTDSGTDTVTG